MNRFDALAEFEKEFKRLFKKYRTLDDDLEKFKKILVTTPTGIGKNFVIVYSSQTVKIVKARMACRALRDRSLRIVYSHIEQEQRFDFIEIYFKGEKENEDRERIKEYLKN
ncbi:MAG: hypothetical protein A3J55_02800 [Candidatus Ryanbacteria bacterium RIFCSPHIGHO2_02_FULL_45_17b]|uniref:Uncharacterized protein n=1 Tax=Candidatus Ryanbacteria bacterium RIFCSPHIGHO2_01_FULL_45_22 TaxID=1802114 RepID=A0A1G2FZI4_9BACT|nr:MAG: hypothetical protein A2719_05660 [Candidatus Ryanbacteria bacterium RIFCSPHIGHO2_01_FULL_45_22]OGZ47341.1 MAG: hypothetical protein A3J55_02800 [Candidatus Ryanbacteria bacterium RIFCSPHIGHO2_02_FULL_45_17b]